MKKNTYAWLGGVALTVTLVVPYIQRQPHPSDIHPTVAAAIVPIDRASSATNVDGIVAVAPPIDGGGWSWVVSSNTTRPVPSQ